MEVIELGYEGYERPSFQPRTCALCPLECHNDSGCCARSGSCDARVYVISKFAHQPFVSGPQPYGVGEEGRGSQCIYPRYHIINHPGPSHEVYMDPLWRIAEFFFPLVPRAQTNWQNVL